ncbi:MAG: hypothetical protein AB1898_26240 [Acidobacteriota bacterium]
MSDSTDASQLAHRYLVIPGHRRFELFGCHRPMEGPQGERFRRLVARIANEVGIDPGLLVVNAIAEHGTTIYLSSQSVENDEVGLDYWDTLQHSVLASGIPGVGRIRVRRSGNIFQNEQGRNMPGYTFADGPTALLALAAMLKVYHDRISAAGGPSLTTVTRFALVRYAYHASPQRAVELARTAGSGVEVLPARGPAGASSPLRTATIRAVQAIAVSEDYFR